MVAKALSGEAQVCVLSESLEVSTLGSSFSAAGEKGVVVWSSVPPHVVETPLPQLVEIVGFPGCCQSYGNIL